MGVSTKISIKIITYLNQHHYQHVKQQYTLKYLQAHYDHITSLVVVRHVHTYHYGY